MVNTERELFQSKLDNAELKVAHLKEIFDLHVKCAEVALQLARVEAERRIDQVKGWVFALVAVVSTLVAVASYFKH